MKWNICELTLQEHQFPKYYYSWKSAFKKYLHCSKIMISGCGMACRGDVITMERTVSHSVAKGIPVYSILKMNCTAKQIC